MSDRKSLLEIIKVIPDYRNARGRIYTIESIRFCIICGFMCGCYNAVDISDYIDLNFDFFKELLDLRSVPSHDTLSLCLRKTDWCTLSDELSVWLDNNFPEVVKKYGGYEMTSIDGKAIKGMTERVNDGKPRYFMDAQKSGGTISLASREVGEKKNEISELPGFISSLSIENNVITIDAIGTQQSVIDMILKKKAHYLLPVKSNQESLSEIIKAEAARKRYDGSFERLPYCSLVKKGHGRIEEYKCRTLIDTTFLADSLPRCSSFNTIGNVAVIEKTTRAKEDGGWKAADTETMYYITDLTNCNPLTLLECKIDHWCIESSHWKLDVIMREDYQTARKENAGINMTIIRRLVMRLAQASDNPKDKKLKYFTAHCYKDNDFMLKCLLMSE